MKRIPSNNYLGIYYMLLAAASFSVMSGFAKQLKPSFNAPQLVFYRNLIGLAFLAISLAQKPVTQTGGKPGLLIFRGVMGTFALYTLLFNILHIPLGAAMTYNTVNTIYIALLSWLLFKERLSVLAWICVWVGFLGVMLIYRPSLDFHWKYHLIGLLHGLFSALAYLSIGRINKYYDTRIIVLSFLGCGLMIPLISFLIGWTFSLPPDELFITWFKIPDLKESVLLLGLGITALIGQYYVTKAFSNEKAGIVAAIGYSNILFSLIIGVFLGDAWPDWIMFTGIVLVIISGIVLGWKKND
jgi:hypothetical protein